MAGEIERAKLFADVDELIAWKRQFELKQAEEIVWKANVEIELKQLKEDVVRILEGCGILMETDTTISQRIDDAWKRIDIVNMRLRKLEQAK